MYVLYLQIDLIMTISFWRRAWLPSVWTITFVLQSYIIAVLWLASSYIQ